MFGVPIGRRKVAAVVALLLAVFLTTGLAPQRASASIRARSRTEMLTLTNRSRESHNLPDLVLNYRLSRYAQKHSKSMSKAGEIFHSTNLQGVLSPFNWSVGGENVGVGGSLQSLQDAFMASPEHRQNILRSSFDYVGIGVVHRGGMDWVTVIFYG